MKMSTKITNKNEVLLCVRVRRTVRLPPFRLLSSKPSDRIFYRRRGKNWRDRSVWFFLLGLGQEQEENSSRTCSSHGEPTPTPTRRTGEFPVQINAPGGTVRVLRCGMRHNDDGGFGWLAVVINETERIGGQF